MQPQSPPPPPPPPGREAKGGASGGARMGGMPRWSVWVLLGVLLLGFVLAGFFPGEPREDMTYSEFREAVSEGRVATIEIDNNNGSSACSSPSSSGCSAGPRARWAAS
jgi:hypothetical protein